MKRGTVSAWLLATGGALLLVARAEAISDADKCEAAKNKIAGKYALCRQKAEAKAIKKGDAVDYSKCDTNFAIKWGTVETDSGGMCPTIADQAAIQACVTAHSDDIAAALNGGACGGGGGGLLATGQTRSYGTGTDGDVEAGVPLSYTDNGDGTITDNNTGLMWEKKDDSGGIHDKDNTYTWCVDAGIVDGFCDNNPTYDIDGTIVTTFLATLNGGFAGYTDWRIPNRRELESIIDAIDSGASGPAIDPAFHQSATCSGCTDVTAATCSCTVSSFYWSSTTYSVSQYAWYVLFTDGVVSFDVKPEALHVRAVRGGL